MFKHLPTQLAHAIEQVKAGKLDIAIDNLKEILADNPEHEISLGMLASIYLQIGMHERAIELYNALLAKNPENPLARFQLGMAQLSLGLPQAALATWEPMLELPDDFMARFHSALALVELGRHRQALPLLIEAAGRMPRSHPLYPRLLDLQAQLETFTRDEPPSI